MNASESSPSAVYKNVMELLVEAEVEQQFNSLPPHQKAHLKDLDVIAYALNQLPALYATSERGLDYQLQRGRAKFAAQITQAVQRAIAAVRRDPIKNQTTLTAYQFVPSKAVLDQLRSLLEEDSIDWETLPHAVDRAIKRALRDGQRVREAGRYTTTAIPRRAIAPQAVNHDIDTSSTTDLGWGNPFYR
jgi:Late competence development protein ComFB